MLGNIKEFKPFLSEAVNEVLTADIRARKTSGHIFDPNVLALDENTVILKKQEDGTPVIVAIYQVQQINCVRNRDGEILEVSSLFMILN